MAQTTQRLVVEVKPAVAELLADVAEGHNVSKRAVVECAIEHYAKTLGYAQKETTR